jgi:hypothetical protein
MSKTVNVLAYSAARQRAALVMTRTGRALKVFEPWLSKCLSRASQGV